MFKRFRQITLILIVLILLALWSPWKQYNWSIASLFGVEEVEKFAGLEVYSLKDTLNIYFDDELIGEVSPDEGVFEKTDVKPGNHIIKLTKKVESENSYYVYTKAINFVEDFDVVVAYELGPTEIFSQGHVFYVGKDTVSYSDQEKRIARLNISTEQDGVEIYLDNDRIGETEVEDYELSLTKLHKIKLTKKNYESLEFDILPDKQEDRDKLAGYELFIDAQLFLIPLKIDKPFENYDIYDRVEETADSGDVLGGTGDDLVSEE